MDRSKKLPNQSIRSKPINPNFFAKPALKNELLVFQSTAGTYVEGPIEETKGSKMNMVTSDKPLKISWVFDSNDR